MTQIHLDFRLGVVSGHGLERRYQQELVHSLDHDRRHDITFSFIQRPSAAINRVIGSRTEDLPSSPDLAHQAGVNCLTLGHHDGRFLASGGADAAIRIWDLESPPTHRASADTRRPSASLSRSDPASHTHAITSISIYPFDPVPTTLLTTSHDKSLKVISIGPGALTPVHTFSLDHSPYTHSLSTLPDSSPLVAVGTAHPAVRLLDLRSGLSTHALSGHNGAVYSVAWSPKQSHVLSSGASDGRVLFFDIRRANAAFASLDLDDAIGVIGEDGMTGAGARGQLLDWNARAHNGAVTGVLWNPSGDKIVSAGHDQRLRVWDAATGRNDLVHFGPRVRNERIGELKPLISPLGAGLPGRELLFWPNDDGKGEIFMHHLREGDLLRILRTRGTIRTPNVKQGSVARLTSGGRINAMVWRSNAASGEGLEMYSAHGDGRICTWIPALKGDAGEDEDDGGTLAGVEDEAESKRKRKRDLIGDLVEGLTKRPITFS